jgi:hypothetical protein
MRTTLILWCGTLCLSTVAVPAASAPLTEATFTRIINDVKVARQATQAVVPAKINDLFQTPDVVRTAVDSLAELTAADRTITRVGANTVFSFSDSGRTVNLQQGSLLFHSPKGRGGGTIKTGGATAAVLGTTLMVSATPDGGFKVIVLEGRARVTLPGGDFRQLTAGQLLFVLPGQNQFGPRLMINLGTLVRGSRLVNGFPEPLPAMPEIDREIIRQDVLISTGQAEDTRVLVGTSATRTQVEVVDPNVVQSGVSDARNTPSLGALGTDVFVQSANLNLFPSQLFLNPVNTPIGNFPADDYTGLLGRNLTIDHPNVQLLNTASGFFDFAADGTLKFNNVTGPSPGLITFLQPVGPSFFDLYFTGGQGINFGNTSQINYSGSGSGNLFFASGSGLSMGAAGAIFIQNPLGGIGIGALGSLNVNSVDFNSDQAALSSQSLTVTDQAFFQASGSGSSVRFFGNTITVGGASPMSITADSFSAQGPTMNESVYFAPYNSALAAATQAGFLNVEFNSSTLQARIDAQTIILDSVSFFAGSSAVLRTGMGLANINNGVMTGYANFVNSTYAGAPINVSSLGVLVADLNNPNLTAPIQVQQLP